MTGEQREQNTAKRIKKYIATFEVTDRDLEEHTPDRLRKIVEERSNYEFPDGTHIKLIHLGKGRIADIKITNEQIMDEIEDRLRGYKEGGLDLDVALFDIADIVRKYGL